jgi:hypothetical protein
MIDSGNLYSTNVEHLDYHKGPGKISKKELYELSRKTPYYRYVNFDLYLSSGEIEALDRYYR